MKISEREPVRLHYCDQMICDIYAEALENETGMPVENLYQVFDYDNYILTYNAAEDKTIIKICGAYVQFEMDETDIYVVHYGMDCGWQLGCESDLKYIF